MRITTMALALALTVVGQAAAQFGQSGPRSWGYAPTVQVWIENDRGYFRRGERLRAGFTTSADAYVAVVHIDPDGRLEFLYPSSPWDSDYVLGGRTYPIPYRRAGSQGWMVRSGAGIGYLYVIASPVPLDFSRFQGRSGGLWDWGFAGRTVRGDPFWAFEQITRYLVPDWGYGRLAVDYYSYHVGGVQRYPSYACGGPGGWGGTSSWGWGWGGGYTPSYYGSCDRLDGYLRSYPNYFDAQRYRGDRRAAFRSYGPAAPAHGFKENPENPTVRGPSTATPRSTTPARPAPESTGRATPATPSRGTTTTEPARRPSLEPRSTPAPASSPAPAPTTRRTTGDSGPQSSPAPARGSGGGEPASTQPGRRPAP